MLSLLALLIAHQTLLWIYLYIYIDVSVCLCYAMCKLYGKYMTQLFYTVHCHNLYEANVLKKRKIPKIKIKK